MTHLAVEPLIIPAAAIGPENPLPVFRADTMDTAVDFEANHIPEEERVGLGWQNGWRALPYRMQDGYSRNRIPRAFTSVVLENEFLKVTVLPEVGGLVRSIIYKPLGREMLDCNPIFQPGNVALRNAWVSGGIEWNTPHLGHHYLTCSPVHAAEVTGTQGEPVLRLYAWDRVKCFPYQIDLHLPPGSPMLFARVRLINPHDREIPMYWWTNVGVPEYPDGRVLAPADSAYKGMSVVDIPVIGGLDHTYATRVQSAYDLFFRIPETRRPFVAIVDRDGRGFIHTSTRRLKGRKMFAWGMGPGSRRWQEYLAVPGRAFQEIQAGLGHTQSHSIAMPARTQWAWTEAMGYLESDPRITHSPEWPKAYTEAARLLEDMLPEDRLTEADRRMAEVTVRPPKELLFRGLGWGALENQRRSVIGLAPCIPPELPFGKQDLGDEQEPWLRLLDHGALPRTDPLNEPGHFMIQDEWRMLLEQSPESGKGDHWLSWYHLGVMRMESGNTEGATEAWRASLDHSPSAWALRNLAVVEARAGDKERACQLLQSAWEIGPPIAALAIELGQALAQLSRFDDLAAFVAALPADVASHERMVILKAQAALHEGRYGELEEVFRHEFATIREGEVTLTDIWFRMHERKLSEAEGISIDDELRRRVRREFRPPRNIDFRMFISEEERYVAPQETKEQ